MNSIFEAKSLYLTGAITNSMLVLLLMRQLWDRLEPATAFWLAASACLAVGSMAAYLLGPGPMTLMLSGGCALLAISFSAIGVRLLRAPSVAWRHLLWLPVMVAGIVMPVLVLLQHRAATLLYFVAAVVIGLIALREAWLLKRDPRLRLARDLALLYFLILAWTTYRFVQVSTGPAMPYSFAGAVAAGILGPVFCLVGLGIAREKQLLAEAELEAAAHLRGRLEVERLHAGLPALVFLLRAEASGSYRTLYIGGDSILVSGWPVSELLRVRDEATASAPALRDRAEVIRVVLRDGACSFDWRTTRPDGRQQWLRSSFRLLKPYPDGGGEIVGYLVNVTAEREAAAQANTRARMAAVGEMAAGLAHELKQPLGAIKLANESAERALDRGDKAGVRERLHRAVEQSDRAAGLIEQLRRFAAGSDEASPLDLLLLDLVVQNVLVLVGSSMTKAGIKVVTKLGDVPPLAMGREVALEQVLLNLLLNARYALDNLPPGAPRWVRIIAEQEAERVRLIVSDSGGGIPADMLPRMFEPFSTSKGADEASGLGLAVCHGLMAAMGGSITGYNGPAGAIFTLELAAAPPVDLNATEVQCNCTKSG